MVKFILRTLLGVPTWLAYIAIQVPLILIGFPLVALLALWIQMRWKYTSHARPGNGITPALLHWPRVFGLRLFYLWDNDEDGLDGDPWTNASDELKNPEWFEATANWSVWRRVFVWSAWRNSVGNARRLPFLGMDIKDPKDMVVSMIPTNLHPTIIGTWDNYRKLGPYLARYGYRFELKFPYPKFVNVHFSAPRYFWIGWRIAQQDAPNTDIGFAFQPWAKL